MQGMCSELDIVMNERGEREFKVVMQWLFGRWAVQ